MCSRPTGQLCCGNRAGPHRVTARTPRLSHRKDRDQAANPVRTSPIPHRLPASSRKLLISITRNDCFVPKYHPVLLPGQSVDSRTKIGHDQRCARSGSRRVERRCWTFSRRHSGQLALARARASVPVSRLVSRKVKTFRLPRPVMVSRSYLVPFPKRLMAGAAKGRDDHREYPMLHGESGVGSDGSPGGPFEGPRGPLQVEGS